MERIIINVMGMSSAHCKNAIRKAVSALEGASEIDIDIQKKRITIEHLEGVNAPANFENEIEDLAVMLSHN